MTIKFRNYTNEAGITKDYQRVREFFLNVGYCEFTYARWDWMITHGKLDKSSISKIGLWEDNDQVVGVATYDTMLGTGYCMTLPEYKHLKQEMLSYAKENLKNNNKFRIVIPDTDSSYQEIAAQLGFRATTGKENDAIFYVDQNSMEYKLPDGFRITSMKETFDLYQYGRVMWKGFNHELNGEGEFVFSKEEEASLKDQMLRDNVDLNLKVAVVSPDGNFVSYCGMWYDPKASFAVIEPVATDPDYRKLGLGKAAVLEGIKRVSMLGAKKVVVGSGQQFYYSIGLRPCATSTEWG